MSLVDRKRVRDYDAAPDALKDRIMLPEGVTDPAAFLAGRAKDAPIFLRKPEAEVRRKLPWYVSAYLQYTLRDVFGDAFDTLLSVRGTPGGAAAVAAAAGKVFGPLPVCVPHAGRGVVAGTLALLKAAKRPVLLVASQALLFDPSGRAGVRDPTSLVAAIEALGVPTFLGGMARGLLGSRHPQFLRQCRKDALAEADVVILAGTVCDFRLDYGRSLSRRSKIVAVNRNADALARNTDMFWAPTLAAVADPAEFLLALATAAGGAGLPARYAEWLGGLRAKDDAKEAKNGASADERAEGHDRFAGTALLNPLFLLSRLEAALPSNAIMVGDGGDFVATAAYVTRPRAPLSWLDPGAFGTLGVGMGFALGAKLVRPDAEVWLLWGDGSVGYSIAEFDTARRHGIPVLALVGNDAAWSQIEREQVPMLGDNVACALDYTPYETVARGYGGDGVEVRTQTADAVDGAIAWARGEAAKGVPTLVNALIGRTNFREGSLSV